MVRKFIKITIIVLAIQVLLAGIFFGFYNYWNTKVFNKNATNRQTDNQVITTWSHSAHRNFQCNQCHGSALNNEFNQLKEKFGINTTALNINDNQNAGLTEPQMREMMPRCVSCHKKEYSNWVTGGHSATYGYIFLNKKHNSTERLNADCLRCHGMFYNGSIDNLVTPIDKKGSWKLKDSKMANQPAILCMACHKMHIEKYPDKTCSQNELDSIKANTPKAGFYSRPENYFFRADLLPHPKIWNGKEKIAVNDDKLERVCVQCHAPNSWHQSGTGDDRTPSGVHQGLSCLTCHSLHSNKTAQSCITCHPALSSCKIPVEKMNTTFKDPKSKHNIHFLKCTDCHNGIEAKMISSIKPI